MSRRYLSNVFIKDCQLNAGDITEKYTTNPITQYNAQQAGIFQTSNKAPIRPILVNKKSKKLTPYTLKF